jgi:hypothetical protein
MAIKPGWADLASAGLTPATGARTTRFCRTRPPPTRFRQAMCQSAEVLEGDPKTQAPFVQRAVDAHGKIRPASSLARRRCRVHRIHPALVTIATRPSMGWNESRIAVSLPIGEAKYFSAWGWTRNLLICPSGSLQSRQRIFAALFPLAPVRLSPCGRGRIASRDAIRVRGNGLSRDHRSRTETPHPDFPLTREIRPLPQGERRQYAAPAPSRVPERSFAVRHLCRASSACPARLSPCGSMRRLARKIRRIHNSSKA